MGGKARKSITYMDWRVTMHKGRWKATHGTGDKKRRFSLPVPLNAPDRDIKAALVKLVSEKQIEELRGELTIGVCYARYVERKKRQKQTSAAKSEAYWKALEPWFSQLHPYDVSDELCMNYTEARSIEGKAQATIWSELTEIQLAINYARDQRWISEDVKVWKPSKGKGRERVCSPEEFIQLLQAVDMKNGPHMVTVLLLALMTSARKAAILGLTWDRVDFNRGTIEYRDEDVTTYDPISKGYKKGRGIVPMTEMLFKHLWELHRKAKTRWVVELHGAGVDDIQTAMEGLRRRSGVEGVTLHTLRHTAATWADQAGVDSKDTAVLLAHASDAITKRVYIHKQDDRQVEVLRPVVNVIESRIKRKA